MNAKESREKAMKVNGGKGSQYAEIIKLIYEASKKGEYSMFFYESVDKDARKKLTDEGYKVGETSFDRNESLTKISW